VNYPNNIKNLETFEEKKWFIEKDDVDGEWLSPFPREREWQEKKLVEIFGHYPNASPKWQYLNGLIHVALEHLGLPLDLPKNNIDDLNK
jgi:hypothetical protein